jgi:hypothetical protein
MADLALPHVDGPYPKGYKAISWVGALILKASITNQAVNRDLSRVTSMLAHPGSLARPGLLLRALLAGVRG